MSHIKMQDVAKKAGVSMKTVSRVINSEANISQKTKDKVLQAIAELGFVPHASARSLSSGRAMTVGMVLSYVQPVTDQYTSTLIEMILTECNSQHYRLMLLVGDMTSPDNLLKLYLGRDVDGFFIDQKASANQGLIHQLETFNIPYVIIHPDSAQLSDEIHASIVRVTDRQGAKEAIKHLIDLGHCCIGHISDPDPTFVVSERLAGYQEALSEAAIPFRPELVYQADFSADEPVTARYKYGFEGANRLIEKNPDITAIFAVTDFIAIGVFHGIIRMGFRIPEDISLVGFDDIDLVSHIFPPLTTVHQPMEDLARFAVDYLIEKINDPTAEPKSVVLDTHLVVRESCQRVQVSNRKD